MGRLRQRLTLTKAERQTAAAVELLALLETTTADGRLTDEEIKQIQGWLKERDVSQLACIEYLRTVLDHVLGDGRITELERREVFKALERVLPAEMRARARERRLAWEAVERIRKKEEREQESLRGSLDKPILRLDFPVVGVPYEGRHLVVRRYARPNLPVYLLRERSNLYDPNAIMVLVAQGYQIGYVPREDAAVLAPQLDAGCKQKAWIKKIIEGPRYPTPYVLAEMYHEASEVTGALAPAQLPARRELSWSMRHWGPSCAIIAAVLGVMLWLLLLRACGP